MPSITKIKLQNFRKLKSCRIEFSDKETLFVGANNSGKTSAMDALIFFLKDKNKFTTKDFTLTNWSNINQIREDWIETKEELIPDLSRKIWIDYLPKLDVWLNVKSNEVYYVNHIIPTLDWTDGLLGVRLVYEPKNIEILCKEGLIKVIFATETFSVGIKI